MRRKRLRGKLYNLEEGNISMDNERDDYEDFGLTKEEAEEILGIWNRWNLDADEKWWIQLLIKTMAASDLELNDVQRQRVSLCFSEFCELFARKEMA
jgi:hypothetical protein